MNVVDSSGWLEYFADGPNAKHFAGPIRNLEGLIVPTLSLFEVFKRVSVQRGEGAALKAVAAMRGGQVVELDARLALSAARISLNEKLPLADSVMIATAREFGAVFWTQDADFESKKDVRFIAKR